MALFYSGGKGNELVIPLPYNMQRKRTKQKEVLKWAPGFKYCLQCLENLGVGPDTQRSARF